MKKTNPTKQKSKKFPKSSQLKASFLKKNWEIIQTAQDGNCGPDAIAKALSFAGKPRSIKDIRKIIADAITVANVNSKLAALALDHSRKVKKAAKIALNYNDPNEKVNAAREIVTHRSYFITTHDLPSISGQLDLLIIALNADYKAKDAAVQNQVIHCNADNEVERKFFRKIQANNQNFDVLLLLLHKSSQEHYELLFNTKHKRAIVLFSQIPKPLKEVFTRTCIVQMKDMVRSEEFERVREEAKIAEEIAMADTAAVARDRAAAEKAEIDSAIAAAEASEAAAEEAEINSAVAAVEASEAAAKEAVKAAEAKAKAKAEKKAKEAAKAKAEAAEKAKAEAEAARAEAARAEAGRAEAARAEAARAEAEAKAAKAAKAEAIAIAAAAARAAAARAAEEAAAAAAEDAKAEVSREAAEAAAKAAAKAKEREDGKNDPPNKRTARKTKRDNEEPNVLEDVKHKSSQLRKKSKTEETFFYYDKVLGPGKLKGTTRVHVPYPKDTKTQEQTVLTRDIPGYMKNTNSNKHVDTLTENQWKTYAKSTDYKKPRNFFLYNNETGEFEKASDKEITATLTKLSKERIAYQKTRKTLSYLAELK